MRFCPIPKWDVCIVFRCKLPHFKIRFFPNGLELQNPMPKNWQFMYFYWVFCSQNVWPLMKSYEKSASSAPSAGQLENHVFDLCWPLYVPFCRMRHIMLVVLNNKIQFQSQRAMIGSSRGEERGYDSLFLHTVLCFCDFVAV